MLDISVQGKSWTKYDKEKKLFFAISKNERKNIGFISLT
jgi:hypothetical protein